MDITAIIPAGGTGSRYSEQKNKLLENINYKPLILLTLEALFSSKYLNKAIIPTNNSIKPELEKIFEQYIKEEKIILIEGGETRQASVYNALKYIDDKNYNTDFVLIHDGARPLIKVETINKAIEKAINKKAVIVAVKAKDTIKKANKEQQVIETLNRDELWQIQTPQIFEFKTLYKVHQKYKGQNFTDDAGMMEKDNKSVFIEEGCYSNIKITTPEDILIAQILKKHN